MWGRTVTHCRFFDCYSFFPQGFAWLLHPRCAGNLKLGKVLRFRASQQGGTYEARPAFDAVLPLVADNCCRPESDYSNPYDSCDSVTGKRAVLGRFMGVGWTAAATPTAIQSFWRLLGRSARELLGRSADGKPSVPASEGKGQGNREAGTTRLLPRAAVLAPKGGHGQDCGDERCKCRLVCLRA